MGRKLTALALAALLAAGLSGCSSGSNVTTDRSYGTGRSYGSGSYYNGTYGSGSYNNGTGHSGGWTDTDGTRSDNRTRYEEMLENGRVHDTDGYLLDGENRHD